MYGISWKVTVDQILTPWIAYLTFVYDFRMWLTKQDLLKNFNNSDIQLKNVKH